MPDRTRPLYESSHDRKDCPTCNGEGTEDCGVCDGFGGYDHDHDCEACGGTGLKSRCDECDGRGWVRKTDADKEAEGQRRLFEEGAS